jgi:DeoR/GlpR family transcriptional regulator of sugar metabolism
VLNDRQALELELILKASGAGRQRHTADSLKRAVGVSLATIYTDLELLEQVRVRRNRGLVELVAEAHGSMPERFSSRAAVKRLIAEAVLEQRIPRNSIVYLDTGSTCFFVAKAIVEHSRSDLGIVTPNPYVLQALAEADFAGEVVSLGGSLRRRAASLHGDLTVAALRQLRFDIAVLSVDFLHDDAEGTLSIFSNAELEQKRSAIERASHAVVVVADDSKLGRNLGHRITDLVSIRTTKSAFLTIGIEASVSAETRRQLSSLQSIVGDAAVSTVTPDSRAAGGNDEPAAALASPVGKRRTRR